MPATAFSLDSLTLEYSQDDYKPASNELKTGLTYEWKVNSCVVKQAPEDKGGHLQISMECHALDGDGKKMGQKYANCPLPVSLGAHSPPDYAKKMWLSTIAPFFPELSPFDEVRVNSLTNKREYIKDGEAVKGARYTELVTEANKAVGEKARDFAKLWIEQDQETCAIAEIEGKHFFAETKHDKSGRYVNFGWMHATCPGDKEVVYDRKVALPQ